MILSLFAYYLIGLPMYLLFGWFVYRRYHARQQCSKGFFVGWQLLALLLTMMFSVTGAAGIDNIAYQVQNGGSLIQLFGTNVIPFYHADFMGMLLNTILFIPFGILLPIVWRPCSKKIAVQAGFLLSAAIEFSQLFNGRTTDINDLMTNTLGTFLGYILYTLLFHRITWFQAEDSHSKRTMSLSIAWIFIIYICVGSPVLTAWGM